MLHQSLTGDGIFLGGNGPGHFNEGDLLAQIHGKIQCGLTAHQTATDDGNVVAHVLTLQTLFVGFLGGDDIFAFHTGNAGDDGIGTYGGDDCIRFHGLHHFRGGLCVEQYVDTQLFHHVDLVVHELSQILLKFCLTGEYQLAAKLSCFFDQGHIVSTLSRYHGSLHAGGAAADDHNFFLFGGLVFQHFQPVFPGSGGVDGAGKGGIPAVVQTVEAADAGDDLVLPTVEGFVRHMSIGNEASCHGHKVSAAGGDGFFHQVRMLEAAQSQYGNVDLAGLLDLPCQICIVACRQEVVGVHDVLRVGVEAAGGDVGNVDLVLDHLQIFHTVIGGEAALGQLAAGDAVLDQKLPTHSAPDGIQKHNGEFGPIFQAAAEFIGTGVVFGRKDLGDHQTVTAVDHNAVKAAL